MPAKIYSSNHKESLIKLNLRLEFDRTGPKVIHKQFSTKIFGKFEQSVIPFYKKCLELIDFIDDSFNHKIEVAFLYLN